MRGCKVLYSTSQFYSEEQNRPVTIYVLKRAVWDEIKGKNVSEELFKSTSQIQIVLFLRDLWYEVNGQEVPDDNEVWTQKKQEFKERREKNARKESEQETHN